MASARHRTAQRPRPSGTGGPAAVTGRADAAVRLPVSELLFHRAGAPAPFGDDQPLPLPVSAIRYRHPGGAP
jgi:hypothetical protein